MQTHFTPKDTLQTEICTELSQMSPAVLLGPKQHKKCGTVNDLTLDLTYRGRFLWCNVK